MTYTQNITLDLNANVAYPVVYAKQNDVDSRIIHVRYTKDGAEYLVSRNNSVALRARKPDMHMIFIDATVNNNGTVDVTLSQQCLTVAGRVYADLVEFNAAGQMLSTVSFIINVMAEPDVVGPEMISSDDFQYFKNAIDQWDRTLAEAQEWVNGYNGETPLGPSPNIYTAGSDNNASYFSQRANAWANGTINGSAVPSSDLTYQNNAKYYSDLANTRGATQAQLASENGEAWAIGTRNGQAVSSNDPAYNNNSKYYALRTKQAIDTMSFSYNHTTGILSVTIIDI